MLPAVLRPTSFLSVLATLVVAVLSPTAWARCECGPSSCGQSSAGSCCGQSEKETAGCCAQDVATRDVELQQGCCCTSVSAAACTTHGEQLGSEALGCECSPTRPVDVPVLPASSENYRAAEQPLPMWLVPSVPPVDLSLSSRESAALSFHSPPLPLRELYCVWRN